MDSRRYDRVSESPPTPPSPPSLNTSYVTYEHHQKRSSSHRSPSSTSDHRTGRSSRNESPQDHRRRRRRSDSRSSPSRSHRKSRSNDREKEIVDREKSRTHKHSRKERSKSRSRGRSRSRDKRRSRSRNRSREIKPRHRENRNKQQRTVSHGSEHVEDRHAETIARQPIAIVQPNAFKNDGSFMEMFKKMQEQMQPPEKPATSVLEEIPAVPPPLMVGKRRGGRILKTGMVAKPKTEQTADQPKDAWSLYMAEVKKYREVCCQEEDNTRPLVK